MSDTKNTTQQPDASLVNDEFHRLLTRIRKEEEECETRFRNNTNPNNGYNFINPMLELVTKAVNEYDLSVDEILATVRNAKVEQFLALKKATGLKIEPETAKIMWEYVSVLDPYGVHNLPYEETCIGRDHFVCAPGSDEWVWFGDLPTGVWDAIREKHKND